MLSGTGTCSSTIRVIMLTCFKLDDESGGDFVHLQNEDLEVLRLKNSGGLPFVLLIYIQYAPVLDFLEIKQWTIDLTHWMHTVSSDI